MNRQIICAPRPGFGLVAAGALLLSTGAARGDVVSDWLDGFKEGGKVSLDVRARYEHNAQSDVADDVDGFGIRTRLGYTTGEYEGFRAMVEMENIGWADNDEHPALDEPTTELNQAWVSYGAAKIGRQLYTLDDQRFIGAVGWRMNIQTYDAITTSYLINDAAKLNFGYLNRVHRVNATSQDLNGYVGHGSYEVSEALALTAFAYLLDFEDPVLASSNTFGARATGAFPGDRVKFGYAFSYAKQTDNDGSASDFDLDYYAAEANATVSGYSFALGLESLGGNGTTGFTTPLATVHAFNGWADVFAASSLGMAGGLPRGLKDYYASAGATIPGGFPIKFYYHKFKTEEGDVELGAEFDAVVSRKINDYLSVLAKYARYDAEVETGYGSLDKTVFTFEVNMTY